MKFKKFVVAMLCVAMVISLFGCGKKSTLQTDKEFEADKLGMMIIHWAGYDISGVPAFWQKMSGHNANNFDFFFKN